MADVPAGQPDIAAVLAAMQTMMATLSSNLAENTRRSQESSGPASKEPKVNPPIEFSGERALLSTYLGQLELVFALQSSRYDTDVKKIGYAIGYLRGTPSTTVLAIRAHNPLDEVVTTWPKFVDYLKLNYGDSNEKLTAKVALRSL